MALFVLLLALAAAQAGPATRPIDVAKLPISLAAVPAAQQQWAAQRVLDVTGPSFAASRQALAELRAAGPPMRGVLADLVSHLARADAEAIEQQARRAGSPADVRSIEEQLNKLRQDASTNLAQLAKGPTLTTAQQHHAELRLLLGRLNALQAARAHMAGLMARRPELRSLWAEMQAQKPSPFVESVERQLPVTVEKSLGMPLATAMAQGLGRPAPAPATSAWHWWFYRVCRQVEEYNASQQEAMNGPERHALRLINGYRECLGILPLEADARVAQAARRHSKEMVDLKYFAHQSPTEANRTPGHRLAAAGYPSMGFNENIALHVRTAEDVFRLWFNSPPHHNGMVMSGLDSGGVGKWDDAWTLNMARGKRLMLADAPTRAAATIRGEVLKPQADNVTGPGPRTIITETRIYDPWNPDPAKRRIVEKHQPPKR